MLPSFDTMISYLLELYSYLKSSLRHCDIDFYYVSLFICIKMENVSKINLLRLSKPLTKDHTRNTPIVKKSQVYLRAYPENTLCVCVLKCGLFPLVLWRN